MRLFFYGTLTDADLRQALLGGPPVEPAVLAGWRRVALPGLPWPGIMAVAGATVEGVVTAPLGPVQVRRLQRFEGAAYRLESVTVAVAAGSREAGLFVPRRPSSGAEEWDIDRWVRRHKPSALRAVARRFRRPPPAGALRPRPQDAPTGCAGV